jgi:ATPase subunit of ABC transporter with duplicated ATPase domains
MTVQRYQLNHYTCRAFNSDIMEKSTDGRYVLCADHLAAMRELIDTHDLLISQNDIVVSGYKATLKQLEKQIAALTAENSELKTEVEYMDALTRAKMEAEGKWAKAEQRIKELEAANYQMAMNRAASERKVIILTEGHEWGFCEECEKIKKLEGALEWLVNVNCGVSKDGGESSLSEGNDALDNAQTALRKEGLCKEGGL